MKKTFLSTLLAIFFIFPIFPAASLEICTCHDIDGANMTVTTYSVGDEQGCCTGVIAETTGTEQFYALNDEKVWQFVSGSVIPAQTAQDNCCHQPTVSNN